MTASSRWLVAALAVAALAASGCRSKITGNEGNLDFSYVADDDVRNFNKPIAVGAKLDLKVAETGTGKQVQLTSATSDSENVLKVVSFQGDTVVLQGTGSGSALISVEATVPDGSTKPDEVNMLSRVPEVLKLWHTCTESATEAKYLVNQDVFVPYDMEMKNGQAVIGYGYWPVSYSPMDGVTQNVTTTDQQFLHLHTAATKQQVTIASTIDSKTLTMTLVEEGDIDGAALNTGGGAAVATRQGTAGYYHVLASAGGVPVCQAFTDENAVSTSPSNCTVSTVAPPDSVSGPKNEYGWVKVQGLAQGDCTFDVTFTKANAGAGLTVHLTVPIAGP